MMFVDQSNAGRRPGGDEGRGFSAPKWCSASHRWGAVLAFILLTAGSAPAATMTNQPDTNTAGELPEPESPRELYNLGTEKLRAKKLEEAEQLLRSAAASNDKKIVVPAVYNLGHTRYLIGNRELEKALGLSPTPDNTRRANSAGQQALRSARSVLAGEDVDALVAAYRRGSGARKDLRMVVKAIEAALKKFDKALLTWERSSADFRTVHQLDPGDTNAAYNASIIDRQIAELLDKMREQQQSLASAAKTGEELKEAMKQMRERVPKSRAGDLPGQNEEDEEEDGSEEPGEFGREPLANKHPQPMSQEQAAQLLKGMRLDSQRTLPVNLKAPTQSKREGGDW